MGRGTGVVSRGVEACPDAILCGRQDGGLGRVNSEQVDRIDVLGGVAPHTLPRTGSRFRARSLVTPRLCFMHTKRLCNCSPNKRRLAGFDFQDCSFEADAGATPAARGSKPTRANAEAHQLIPEITYDHRFPKRHLPCASAAAVPMFVRTVCMPNA